MLLQESYICVTGVLKESNSGCTWFIQGVTEVLWGSYGGDTKKLQGCYMGVTGLLQGC